MTQAAVQSKTIASREQLLARLSEASEIEHNLMCVYLYAAFSLKDADDPTLSTEQAAAIAQWRREIMTVAREEMVHLLLVSNLLTALGGSAHFGRMNFPQPPGFLPADMQVRLAPFNRDTLQHFVWLERPEGVNEPMGAGFEPVQQYQRGGGNAERLMPHAIDYPTVGAFYAQIESDLDAMAEQIGEDNLFVGNRDAQIDTRFIGLSNVSRVLCLETAHQAIQGIVEQGEGARDANETSHYQRFKAIANAYDKFLEADPHFTPARPAAHNPVMRRPPTPEGKVWIEAPAAADVVDLANAIYVHMLRLLIQAFGRTGPEAEKAALIDAAVSLMFAMASVAEHATTLPASIKDNSCNAGMSFATVRSLAALPYGDHEWHVLTERLDELAARASRIANQAVRLKRAEATLHETAKNFRAAFTRIQRQAQADTSKPVEVQKERRVIPHATITDGVERADGTALSILFEAKRCIHARFCVTGLPNVFKANVQGDWIDPDAASTEALVGVAHACPSGAIRYLRHDGGQEEQAPAVNMARIRENGPYAIHADIDLIGKGEMFRATLCRCGASKNKPFCDGSHHDISFAATGEPETRESEPLGTRGGRLEIVPQKNGPLLMRGALELCAGTGRTVDRFTTARLCRCGGSKTKPFCDGSHASNGFVAD
jgi:CDGSH-type Zn-finger protein/uncharacterized Fe-S cluster protein YjdI